MKPLRQSEIKQIAEHLDRAARVFAAWADNLAASTKPGERRENIQWLNGQAETFQQSSRRMLDASDDDGTTPPETAPVPQEPEPTPDHGGAADEADVPDEAAAMASSTAAVTPWRRA